MRLCLVALAAAATLFSGVASAHAAGALGESFPSGVAAEAPLGFAELCARSPQDCLSDPKSASEPALAEMRAWASQALWSAIFNNSGAEVAAAPASIGRPERPSPTYSQWYVSAKPETVDAVDEAKAPNLAVSSLEPRLLAKINTRMNRSMRRGRDQDLYGRDDYWASPSEHAKRGDCEDYVLAKRQALIEAGAPGEALSIALVQTPRGEMHAVLLVNTSSGEVVLDNLTPWVRPWAQSSYRWVKRQVAGSATHWIAPGFGPAVTLAALSSN